jgi:hypothetical protein
MGDEFYSIIKMISGEEVLSLISIDENDGDPIIVLQNPVIIKMLESKNGSFIKVKPWIELSDEDFFFVKPEKIITMTETKDKKLIDVYTQYISEYDDEEENNNVMNQYGRVKPNKHMGYITSVKKAREDLENIFKLEIEDTKES